MQNTQHITGTQPSQRMIESRTASRSCEYRVIRGPGLVAVAHVAGGAEREVDVVAAGANPVVLTPAT